MQSLIQITKSHLGLTGKDHDGSTHKLKENNKLILPCVILSCVIEKIKCWVMYQNYDKGGTHVPWVK